MQNKIILLKENNKKSYTDKQRNMFMNKIINNKQQEPLEKHINFLRNISNEK